MYVPFSANGVADLHWCHKVCYLSLLMVSQICTGVISSAQWRLDIVPGQLRQLLIFKCVIIRGRIEFIEYRIIRLFLKIV